MGAHLNARDFNMRIYACQYERIRSNEMVVQYHFGNFCPSIASNRRDWFYINSLFRCLETIASCLVTQPATSRNLSPTSWFWYQPLQAQQKSGFSKPIDGPTAKNIPITTSCSSQADFFTNGIGYMLFKNRELAATCVSAFSSSKKVGLDGHTQENFRHQGLAELVRYAFIEKCIQSGKSPNWERFWNKEPFLKLAKNLGFIKYEKYPVYYWEK